MGNAVSRGEKRMRDGVKNASTAARGTRRRRECANGYQKMSAEKSCATKN